MSSPLKFFPLPIYTGSLNLLYSMRQLASSHHSLSEHLILTLQLLCGKHSKALIPNSEHGLHAHSQIITKLPSILPSEPMSITRMELPVRNSILGLIASHEWVAKPR
ncbi:hypothetical protein VNO77_03356 [Canavalia gladiata]|uniref:Uncharacterized protein n=1 Tax=Canavalia gladiata TaxID=3824 RepID=A0AAN9MVC8_CANGL